LSVLKKAKNNILDLDMFPFSGETKESEDGGVTKPTELGVLERASLNH
jgi:hypothetical protein